jgi:hypothetical protein
MIKIHIHLTIKDGYIRGDEIRKDVSRGKNVYYCVADMFPTNMARFSAAVDRIMFDEAGKEITFTTDSDYQSDLNTVLDAVRSGKVLITL